MLYKITQTYLIACSILITTSSFAHADIWDRLRPKSTMQDQYEAASPGVRYGGDISIFETADVNSADLYKFDIDLDKKGGCGFSTLSSLKSAFDLEAGERYLKDLSSSVMSSAPLTLLCYTSQTLCDGYKFLKNSANAMLSLRQKQCQDIQTVAQGLGTYFRNDAQSVCMDKELKAGSNIEVAYKNCVEDSKSSGSSMAASFQKFYSLKDTIEKSSLSPVQKGVISSLIGVDAKIQGGKGETTFKPYAQENYLSNKKQENRKEIKSVIDNFVKGQGKPEDLDKISMPSFVWTPDLMKRVTLIPEADRNIIINKYAGLMALNQLTYSMEDTYNVLEAKIKDPNTDYKVKEAKKEELQILKMKYDIITSRMATESAAMSSVLNNLSASEQEKMRIIER